MYLFQDEKLTTIFNFEETYQMSFSDTYKKDNLKSGQRTKMALLFKIKIKRTMILFFSEIIV